MRAVEHISLEEPLKAEWMVLDTVSREQQLSGEFMQMMYETMGRPVPKVANQDWYERQGYALFAKEEKGYQWTSPVTGHTENLVPLYLRKRLSGADGSGTEEKV